MREEIDVGIEKSADLSHAIKNFGSRLDEAKTTHPELRSYMVAHITNCRFHAIKKKKMSPGDIARSLMNTPRHFLVVMSSVVTSAKLLSSAILHSTGSRVSQGETPTGPEPVSAISGRTFQPVRRCYSIMYALLYIYIEV